MDEEKLDPLVKESIISRLEGWELVEFLRIPIESIIEDYEDDVIDNLDDILDIIGYVRNDNDEDGD